MPDRSATENVAGHRARIAVNFSATDRSGRVSEPRTTPVVLPARHWHGGNPVGRVTRLPAAPRPAAVGRREGRPADAALGLRLGRLRRPRRPSAGSADSGFGLRRSAASSTWSMVSARTSLIDLRISSGMSRRSFSFFLGRITIFAPDEVRGEDLALEPADREHPTAERDLAGHRDVLADRDAGEARRPSRSPS